MTRGITELAATGHTQLAEYWKKFNSLREKVAQVDPAELEVGTTPKDEIARDGTARLYRYRPMVDNPHPVPVFFAYALVGRYTVADLQPDRSLVRKLLEQGLDVYIVDWGHPRPVDRFQTLEDYVCGTIADFVDVVCDHSGSDKVNLFGICQGGIFLMCYASLFPERVNSVTSAVAPYDFHANAGDTALGRGLIHVWAGALEEADIDEAIDATGNLPGETMAQAFGFMTPASTMSKFGLDLLELAEDERQLAGFLRMENWLSDKPDHTAESIRQWLKDFYIGNRLAKGTLKLGDHAIDLQNVTCPVLNIYGAHDVIAPPPCSTALRDLVGTKDYTELEFPGGHIGVFVGKRAQKELAPAIADWMRDKS